MAEDTEVQLNTEKPCCAKRKERYLKLKENRDFLRSALQSVEPKIIELQNEKLNAIKAYEAERERAEFEKEEKEKGSVIRADLEKEILALKSAIASLQQNTETRNSDGDSDIVLLQTCVSELEGENYRLKQLLEEEKQRAVLEKNSFEAEIKKVEYAYEVEKDAKLNESVARAGLEDEVDNLKSEIASLKQNQATESSVDDGNIILLQIQVSELEGEIDKLKMLLEEEKQRADLEKKKVEAEKKEVEDACRVEKEAKLNESAVRAGLEDELVNLKSEMASLKESAGRLYQDEDGEVIVLRTRVSEGEAEISRLKELLANERKVGDLEKKKAEAEMKNAEEARKIEAEARLKESSIRADLENEILDLKSELASLLAEKAPKSQDESGEVVLLQIRVLKAEAESIQLRELLEQEKKRADSEKKKAKAEKKKTKAEREKAAARNLEMEAQQKQAADMQNEISKLKSEVTSLKEKLLARSRDEMSETVSLQSRVSKADAEIERLNKLLDKERNRGDLEKRKFEAEKKKTSEAWQIITSEQNKAAEERRLADIQRRCNEEYKLSVETLKVELNKLRAELVLERSRIEELHRELEAEKQTTTREKIRAESERAKAEEQMKCVEAEKKKLVNEKNRSDHLSQKLEEARQRVEAMEKEIQEIMSAGKMKETLSVTSDASKNADENLMLLGKQLKLEKMHVKHAKRVAKFEKMRNKLLEQELYRLKQDFFQFGHRLNLLDGCFSNGKEGIDTLAKINNSLKVQSSSENERFSGKEPFSLYGKSENELVKARYSSMDWFDRFRSSVEHSAPLSDGSGSSTKPFSGITSTLESLGGSVRDKLQNSAIYTTSTSFSDKPSVGSQENNIFSVPRPDSLMENLKQGPVVPRLSAKSSCLNFNGNSEVAERSCRVLHDRDLETPCLSLNNHDGIIVADRDPASKRKRLSDEVEAIGCLCTARRDFHTQTDETPVNDTSILGCNVPIATCSQMVEELNASGDGRCSTAVLLDDMHARNCNSSKKGKVYLRQTQNLQPNSKGGNEPTGNLETEISKDVEVLNQTVSHANFTETDQSCGDEAVDIVELNLEAEVFPEYLSCDYITKLLEYDDPEKEERFRMAMEMPLSPSLPEIKMPNMEARQLDDNDLKFKSSGNFESSTLHQLEGSNCMTLEPLDEDVARVNLGFCADTRDTSPPQLSRSSTEMGFTEQISGNEVMEAAFAHSGREEDKDILKYFVAFPNTKDTHCISRIISVFEICISKCSLFAQHAWKLNEILVALAEEDMLPKERACVFFSLLLSNFLVVTSGNYRKSPPYDISSCSDSFLTHMRTVMSDTGLRNMFMKQLDLDTLLSLIRSFLVDKQVMIYHDVSSQPHLEREVQIITLINGKSTSLWTEIATTDKLVAGSFILAAICATTGHIGFLCEASYKILQMHRSDSYIMLTVLHVFASLCGSTYIGLSSHSLIMTVVRCIVTLLERGDVAINATGGSYMQCGNERKFRFPPCAQCLFSNGVASVDEVLSLLLDRIQGYAVTVIGNQPKADVSDVFSLVELLAYYMSWDWTRSKIIPQLLKIVESCVMEEILTATILLIGQLGRLGIDDGRCEQVGVEELRCNLVVIFNRNFRLPTQVAIMHALIGLLPSNCGNILKNEELPSDGSENVHASLVRTWFSQLTEEQKSLSVGILHFADEIRN